MKHVLIVDDKAEIRRLVRICTLHRYRVSEAATADEALVRMHQDPPDLVVLDIMLPGAMDGLDLTAAMRADPKLKDTPIVMLTGRGLQGETCGLPVQAFFTKPFSPIELTDCIDRLITADAYAPTMPSTLT